MLSILMTLMIIQCTVVGSGGIVFVDNEKGKLIAPNPDKEMLTEALKLNGNMVGLTYNGKDRSFIILRFDNVPHPSTFKYYIKTVFDEQPAKFAIFASKDMKNWTLLKEEFASKGWHVIPLPNLGEKIYIKIEATGAKGDFGSSLIDAVMVAKESLSPLQKLDLTNMQLMLNDRWIPFTFLPIIFLACLIGSNVILDGAKAIVAAILAFSVPFTLSLIFDIKAYVISALFSNIYLTVLDSVIFGFFFALLFSKVFDKRAKNSQD